MMLITDSVRLPNVTRAPHHFMRRFELHILMERCCFISHHLPSS